MKKALAGLFSIFALMGIAKGQIRFVENQTLDGIGTDKPIFIALSTATCAPCRWMEQNVFTDSVISSYFNENLTSLKYDAEKGYGIILRKKYNITSYPAYIFLNSNKELLLIQTGSSNVKEFLATGNIAISESKSKKTIHDWELDYQKNRSDTALLKKYIFKRLRMNMSTDGYLDHYLSLLSDKDVEGFENQILLFFSDIALDSKWYQYLRLKQENYTSYKDVRIIDELDPKVKILSILDKSAGSVSVGNVKQFVDQARNTVLKMNGNNLDYLLEYLPIKIKAYNQIERVPETIAAIKEFETLLLKLSPENIAAENRKKEALFLSFYRNKGQLDSLQQTKSFQSRLKIMSRAFYFKLEDSFRNIAANHFVDNAGKITTMIKRIEGELNKVVVSNE